MNPFEIDKKEITRAFGLETGFPFLEKLMRDPYKRPTEEETEIPKEDNVYKKYKPEILMEERKVPTKDKYTHRWGRKIKEDTSAYTHFIKNPIKRDNELVNDMERYARMIQSAYQEDEHGQHTEKELQKYIGDDYYKVHELTDTDSSVFRNDRLKENYIAIRGTKGYDTTKPISANARDWLSNLLIVGGLTTPEHKKLYSTITSGIMAGDVIEGITGVEKLPLQQVISAVGDRLLPTSVFKYKAYLQRIFPNLMGSKFWRTRNTLQDWDDSQTIDNPFLQEEIFPTITSNPTTGIRGFLGGGVGTRRWEGLTHERLDQDSQNERDFTTAPRMGGGMDTDEFYTPSGVELTHEGYQQLINPEDTEFQEATYTDRHWGLGHPAVPPHQFDEVVYAKRIIPSSKAIRSNLEKRYIRESLLPRLLNYESRMDALRKKIDTLQGDGYKNIVMGHSLGGTFAEGIGQERGLEAHMFNSGSFLADAILGKMYSIFPSTKPKDQRKNTYYTTTAKDNWADLVGWGASHKTGKHINVHTEETSWIEDVEKFSGIHGIKFFTNISNNLKNKKISNVYINDKTKPQDYKSSRDVRRTRHRGECPDGYELNYEGKCVEVGTDRRR